MFQKNRTQRLTKFLLAQKAEKIWYRQYNIKCCQPVQELDVILLLVTANRNQINQLSYASKHAAGVNSRH